jgi:hypothetical protein
MGATLVLYGLAWHLYLWMYPVTTLVVESESQCPAVELPWHICVTASESLGVTQYRYWGLLPLIIDGVDLRPIHDVLLPTVYTIVILVFVLFAIISVYLSKRRGV